MWWKGTDRQLFTILQHETNPDYLKEVKTIDYIGYSKEFQTYIFKNHAVHKGRLIPINNQDFFNAGKNEVKTLASTPVITLNKDKLNSKTSTSHPKVTFKYPLNNYKIHKLK